MKLHDQRPTTCIELEDDLHAFVDGELGTIEFDKVLNHVEECEHCQSVIEQLRQMARLHRASFNPEEMLEFLDGAEIFQNITSELLDEKINKVADLFYQIGKAYLMKGFNQKNSSRKGGKNAKNNMRHIFRLRTQPLALEKSRMKTGRLFREIDGISRCSDSNSKQVKRARSFFWNQRKNTGNFLEIGRRFIEESLIIDPERAEPRLYLGAFFYAGIKNYAEAKKQFRKVLELKNLSKANRSDALINLGAIYTIECNYGEAKACFKEVVKSGIIKEYPRYYRSIIFLAITYAKLGEFEKSITFFKEIFSIFPKQIEKIRTEIWDLQSFQSVLEARQGFRKDLQNRIPVLFAS